MKKLTALFVSLLFVVFTLGLILFRLFFTAEDEWVCTTGGWIKHGNPAAQKPSTPCGPSPTAFAENIEDLLSACKVASLKKNQNTITAELKDGTSRQFGNGNWPTVLDAALKASDSCGSTIDIGQSN